jgi:hypothetical protein
VPRPIEPLHALLDGTADGILMADIETQQLVDASPKDPRYALG